MTKEFYDRLEAKLPLKDLYKLIENINPKLKHENYQKIVQTIYDSY